MIKNNPQTNYPLEVAWFLGISTLSLNRLSILIEHCLDIASLIGERGIYCYGFGYSYWHWLIAVSIKNYNPLYESILERLV